ncbi:TetR/AcrR family transcriptional regulator [Streptomyces sp. 71268]|uniref:TetR/AcrR family transcriptional regulator n=1 Tax=Streptomyces sp. 71268 TaxID=3002640 RepID=UPI0023F6932B|nr:TetR/AcrR family transcriptional regulator [Streptomyces sp. 71268]WEV25332.1 TetR/AcrR family transcriptional regulator [Streptomyces sp. 71268]
MPKIVDHEARRTRLVEAVWSLAARGGIEQVSLRKVAEEAGVSMGQVQHYYSSMQALIRDALDRAARAVNTTIESAVTAADTTSPEAILRACLYALVSPAAESSRLMRFALVTAGRAVSDPTTAKLLAPGDDELLTFTADLIRAAREERGSERHDEGRTDADICWSLATSLGVDIALGYRTSEAAQRVLDHHIEQVLR